jgi:FtsZ-binding cell division protein ZapB
MKTELPTEDKEWFKENKLSNLDKAIQYIGYFYIEEEKIKAKLIEKNNQLEQQKQEFAHACEQCKQSSKKKIKELKERWCECGKCIGFRKDGTNKTRDSLCEFCKDLKAVGLNEVLKK